MLIGFEYAGYHPVQRQSVDHLVLLENRFGKCIGRKPAASDETTQKLITCYNYPHKKYQNRRVFQD